MSNDIVEDKKVVGVKYTLSDDEGNLIEERPDGDPLIYIQGFDQVLPHIEEALEGKSVGFQTQIVIQPDDYYGEYEEGLVAEVDRAELPEEVEIKVGMEFEIEGPEGEPLIAEVVDVSDDAITLDGNHPLAGMVLHFDLKIVSVRDATPSELEEGKVEGANPNFH